MNRFEVLTHVVDCAVAPDGGSIGIALADSAGATTWFSIDRSFGSRGTPDWNAVSSPQGLLESAARQELVHTLQALRDSMPADGPCRPVLLSFIEHLSESGD
jgi:hypothetical protein